MQLQLAIICTMFAVVIGGMAEDCLVVHKLSRAEIEALSPDTPADKIPENVKCYAKCLLKDYLGKDGKLSLESIGERANAQEKVVLQGCLAKYDGMSSSAPCDYSYLILQCLTLQNKPKAN